jgi:hypothetical protein
MQIRARLRTVVRACAAVARDTHPRPDAPTARRAAGLTESSSAIVSDSTATVGFVHCKMRNDSVEATDTRRYYCGDRRSVGRRFPMVTEAFRLLV